MEVDSRLTHPSIATRILVYQCRSLTRFETVLALHISSAMRITHNNCDLVGISRRPKVRMRCEDELISYDATKDETMIAICINIAAAG